MSYAAIRSIFFADSVSQIKDADTIPDAGSISGNKNMLQVIQKQKTTLKAFTKCNFKIAYIESENFEKIKKYILR